MVKTRRALNRRRLILFRCLAILFGLLCCVLFEFVLRCLGVGIASDPGDPFVGFSESRPLFELNTDNGRYEVSSSKYEFFRPDSFLATKPRNEFRAFCLGGSTVQGRPYAIETSFTTWLELSLKAAAPNRDWRIVNCGGVSYASYRLVPIMQEALAYEPDLFIVYTGQNEFLEDRSYSIQKRTPKWIAALFNEASRLRTFGLAKSTLQTFSPEAKRPSPANMTAEVDALLDYQGGLEQYDRDDAWRDSVVRHYELSLRRMALIARQAHVPLILMNPVSNLNSPPFKVVTNSQLSETDATEFERLWEAAKESDWEQLERKIELLQKALAIDERHANARFLLAKCYQAAKQTDAARREFLRAKDEDICPLRMLESMHEVVKRVADDEHVLLIDVRHDFEQRVADRITDERLLIDHVHPRIEGHQHIADLLFGAVAASEDLTPISNWKSKRDALYIERFDTLVDNYFPESQARLEGLKIWAAGRVERIRGENTSRPEKND